ncbi:pentapeptide repeat-containing protein [Cyanobacterium stanieri LEGE 03274]|uniref:Serine/threonine-protein kinase B n=1 Tax=Cyanobacterium stanieri LEGE 03274 TaxID=1828756 RepID=A0ABR9V6R4_9CHRO|nr:serine/threonine-protein kinase [Cyanobacterium stanieri]MBE9223600.1 pentapeptide repeat-containing protein [Cyanobacterium stanieri LEGE 03274]
MIVSYCVNPSCPEPENHPNLKQCKACGSYLVLNDRYRALRKIGKGGFGSTFLGIDLRLPGNPYCVIKQLRPNAEDPDTFNMALDLFEREAKTLGKIDHPQIPRLLDYFEDQKKFYLVQTLAKGITLQKEIQRHGVFSENATKRFLVEILPVLKYIHSLKMIHRDIKPANIIRREQDGKLVLIDFGAVKDQVNTQLAASNYGNTAFTQFAVGTMGFAPPEQLAMRPVYSSDIYALGSTCLFLLTGKAPKDLSCDEVTGELLWEQEVKVSPNFAKILGQMLEVDLRNRYRMVDEVINDLDMMPYDIELQQGLFTNPKKVEGKPKEHDHDHGDSESRSTSASRLAMAIRARKARQGKVKSVLPTKISPETLLSSFAMGRDDFSNECFNGFNLNGASLPRVNFNHAKFIKTNLEEANLEGSNFYHADFSRARLAGVNLRKAHLLKAELQYADLRNANLAGANLEGANLYKANLCGANLTDASLDEMQLQGAETNWATVFPDGKKRLW